MKCLIYLMNPNEYHQIGVKKRKTDFKKKKTQLNVVMHGLGQACVLNTCN